MKVKKLEVKGQKSEEKNFLGIFGKNGRKDDYLYTSSISPFHT